MELHPTTSSSMSTPHSHEHLRLPVSPSTLLSRASSSQATPRSLVTDPIAESYAMSRQASTSSAATSTYSSIATSEDRPDGTTIYGDECANTSPASAAAAGGAGDETSTVSSSLSPTDPSLFDGPESYTAESSSFPGSLATSPSIHAVGEVTKSPRRKSKQPSHTSKFTSTPPGPLSHARSILEHQAASLLSAARRLREEEMTYKEFQSAQNLIVQTLQAGGKLVWTGVGKSGIIAQKLCSTSLSLGLPSTHLDPMSALHGDLGMLNGSSTTFKSSSSTSKLPMPAADVVIALSHSGSSPELLALLPHLRLRGVRLIALTARQDSGLGSAAQQSGGHWIDCRTAGYDNLPDQMILEEESSGSQQSQSCCPTSSLFSLSSATAGTDEADPTIPAPSSSTTTALAMGDSLVLSCAKMLGLGAQDFGKNHPGGALGKRMMAELEEKTEALAVGA